MKNAVTTNAHCVMLSPSKARPASRALTIALPLLLAAASLWTQALAQDAHARTGADAMKRLAFLSGSWTCTMHGGSSEGVVDHLTYSFTADGRWMIERSDVQGGESSVQIWGYDPAQRRLIAQQYGPQGVATKTVDGWKQNQFVSRRDDNGATIVLQQSAPNAFSWTVHASAPGQSAVRENCIR
ncbi:MAG: hypothetical protein ABR508_07400 [Candidatus Baltobacteraceae bacterium]